MRRYVIGALIGVVLVMPVVSLLSLGHEMVSHAYLLVGLIDSWQGLFIIDVVLFADQVVLTASFFLWGVMVSAVAYARLSRNTSSIRLTQRRGGK